MILKKIIAKAQSKKTAFFLAVHINDEQTTPANIEKRGVVLIHQTVLLQNISSAANHLPVIIRFQSTSQVSVV